VAAERPEVTLREIMMVMTARALDARQPHPGRELLHVSDGVTFIETDDGSGSVFLWGSAAWTWAVGDRVGRRLAAVQLVEARAAPQRRVAAAFGVNEDTLILWRDRYAGNGIAGLAGRRPGPKGPSKLTDERRMEIRALRAQGLTLNAVAARAGVSTDTVRRALVRGPQPPPAGEPVGERMVTRPLTDRSAAQEAAGFASLTDAVNGREVPLAGTLTILPALAATGLLDAAARVYDAERTDGLRAVLLSSVHACLLGERPEGSDDRQLDELAARGRADRLIDELARRSLAAHGRVEGIFYFDGRVHAYRRSEEVPEDDVAGIRLALGGDLDVCTLDCDGEGVVRWTAPAEASAVHDLRAVTAKVRELAGARAHPTICFDRGGWPPVVLAELATAGFDVVTHGKVCTRDEPVTSFRTHAYTDWRGRVHPYLLIDREAHLWYHSGRRRFTCRRIIGLEPRTGLQTEILTTRGDPDPATIAHAMLSRSSQEQFIDSASVPLGDDAPTRDGDRIHEAVRMATYNAVSALARLLVPGHARSGDEARRLLGDVFRTAGRLEVVGDQLCVRLQPASPTVESLAALCAQLTTTRTVFPGSDLTLTYMID
jgi:transposase